MKKNVQAAIPQAQPFGEKYMHLILCGLAFFIYANTINNGYNMDDELVTRNHKLTSKGISAIPDIFTSPYYSDDMGYSYEYRPVVHASFAIEHQFFGESAKTSHLINVLLYVLTVYLLFVLLKKLFHSYSYWVSVGAVLLFMFHPLHSEVVASIKNRDEILALLGAIGAWWFAIKYIQGGKWWALIPMAVFFISGLLSKMSITPMAVVIPFSLLFFLKPRGIHLVVTGSVFMAAVFALSPLNNLMAYIPVCISIALLPYLFWFVLNKKYIIVAEWVASTKERVVKDSVFVEGAEAFSFKLNNEVLVIKEVASLSFVIQVMVSLGLISMGFWTYGMLGPIVGYLVLANLFYRSNVTQKNVLVFLITISFLCLCFFLGKNQHVDFVIFFVFGLFFFDKRFRNILQLISIAIIGGVCIYIAKIEFLFVLLICGVLILEHKYKVFRFFRYALMVLTGVGAIATVVFVIFHLQSWEMEIFIILSNLVLFSLIYPKTRTLIQPVLLFFILPFIIILNVYQSSSDGTYRVVSVHPGAVTEGSTYTMDEGLISNLVYKSERPIAFAEIPVNQSSPLEERLGMASDVLGFYLKKMLVPHPLGYYYGYAYFKPVSIFELSPLLFLLLHVALLAVAIVLCRKHTMLSFGIFFYMASIALFSTILYPVVGVAGDRFSYLASLGFCIALAYSIFLFTAKGGISTPVQPSKPVLLTFAVLLLFYGFLTVRRNSLWDNPITLMSHDIDYLDESAQAHNLYALNLMRESVENKKLPPQKRLEYQKEAVIHFDKALQIWPEFFNAAYDKGRASILIGDYASAIDGFEKAVTIGPEDGFIDPYIQLSQLYEQTGRYNDYLVNAKRILALNNEAQAYNMVAKGFYVTGQRDSAKNYLRKGMANFPEDESLRMNMAEIFRVEANQDSVDYYLRR